MSFTNGRQPTVSRTPRGNRNLASRRAWGRSKLRTRRLFLEALEDRRVLAVDLFGLPNWLELGSKPITSAGSISDPNNPASGGIESVAIDPANYARIFVGSINGGIWRTTNGDIPFNGVDDNGTGGIDDPSEQPDWQPLTDNLPSLAIGDIRFSPLDPTGNTLFAGTGSASSNLGSGGTPIGILRTTDGGNNWSVFPVTPGPGEPQIRAVLPTTFDGDVGTPGVQQVVLVGANSATGMYRSTDGGQTYSPVSGANGLPAGAVTQIIADPNNASRFFAGVTGQGVFRSDDGGANWTPANTGLVGLGASTAIPLASHPGGGATVLYTIVSGPALAVFTSNNGGANWTPLAALPAAFTSGFNGLYSQAATDQITVDPTNSQIVYVAKGYGGTPFLYRYNPSGGGSWVEIEDAGANGTRPHADQRDLQFIGTNVLLASNDGGSYFLRSPQSVGANRWTSFHGVGTTGLGVTEYTNVAWDSTFNVASGGAQDNGTSVQSGAGNTVWTSFRGADGGDVQVDTVNAGAGRVFRYSATQNFGLTRHTFDSATNQPVAAVSLDPAGGLPGYTNHFVTAFELNSVAPERLVTGGTGTSPVYELLNAATAPNAAGATWQAIPVGAGFTTVNDVNGSAFTVGGRLGGMDNPEVLVVGSGSGVFVRSTAGGTLTATPTAFPGGSVRDIALDPENWRHMFVIDGSGVYESPDAGITWNNVSFNISLVNTQLQTVEFIPTATGGVAVVGGNLGVSRLLGNVWTRFGLGLPNALVNDLDYNATDDVLLAGEYGRGAWDVSSASILVQQLGGLDVCGDSDYPNEDDTFRLVRNAQNPLMLEVYVNNVLEFTGPLAAIQQINIFAAGGNDLLIVDSSNGLITVPNGIRYDGDHACPEGVFTAGIGGFDRLDLVQTGGSASGVTDVLAIGATNGSGRSTITSGTNIQRVDFQYLEPVVDSVPAASFSITSIPGLASLLQDDNAINYSAASLIPPPVGTIGGCVTVDAFEPIEFTNKTNLIIDAGSGNDTINLNNSATPTGLASITVNGGDPTGSDTVIANGTLAADTIVLTPTGADAGTLTGAGPVAITLATAEHLTINGQGGNDSLTVQGTAANDIINYTPGSTPDSGVVLVNSLLPLAFSNIGAGGVLHFTDQGGTFNKLVYNGTDTNDNFEVNGVSGVINVQENVNSFLGGTSHINVTVPTAGNLIQALALNTFDGDDSFVINSGPLFTGGLAANGGNPSGSDRVTLNGSAAADVLGIAPSLLGDSITGIVGGRVILTSIEILTLNGAGGNDAYTLDLGSSTDLQTVNLFSGGDAGDSLTVNGQGSDDTMQFTPITTGTGRLIMTTTGGSTTTSPLFFYSGFLGTLTTFGSAGVNTVEVIATAGNDVINAEQPDSTHLNLTLNTFAQVFTISAIQRANIVAGSGDDLIRVSVADALVLGGGSLAFGVDGGSPNASDRLIVNDDGLGDLTILRQAPDQRSGSVTVGTLNPVFYSDIERLDITPIDPVTGGVGIIDPVRLVRDGRIVVFHNDPFEYNDTRLTAATLSRVGESANRPTIDPGAVVAPFAVPGDEDWYDFRPQATGTFAVKILFDLYPELANGRAGLPGNGDLKLDIYDAEGGLITSGVPVVGGSTATFGATNDPAFPKYNRIFVRVHGVTPESLNHYEFDNLDAVGTGNPGVGNADLFGPQVTDVQVNDVDPTVYNIFGEKILFGHPNAPVHPTPLTNSLLISFQDLPKRFPGFVYSALDQTTAEAPGTFVLKGDATGIVSLTAKIEPGTNLSPGVGGLANAKVRLTFSKPLPDDRFTLTINDNLLDPAGNKLDGESNAAEPNGAPSIGNGKVSGDGHAGGAFIARFTIDSRAELGTFSSGSVYVDTNGNYQFDPTNTDSSNRDITYLIGFTSDNIFAGNFTGLAPAAPPADGFDKLAAYGKVGLNYRWLIDTNNDGVVDLNVVQPLFAGLTNINGMPAAGNFDGNAANGDEVVLKVGNTWLLDKFGHNFVLDTKLPGTNMVGLPIVGDFDGDGIDDLGSWADDKFYLNLSTLGPIDGTADRIFTFGFASVRERPVAGDFDADGITDLGLWVPDRSGVAPSEAAEWYLLLSGGQTVGTGQTIVQRLNAGGGVISFKPTPFGNDLYAQFGDEFGLPVPGNFDPPITSTQPTGGYTNSRDRSDVDNDGSVSPIDALLIINLLNSGNTSLASTPFTHAPFVDVNGDGSVSPIDALMVINQLNSPSGDSGISGEGEAADTVFAELGNTSGSNDSLSALLLTDDYFTHRKK